MTANCLERPVRLEGKRSPGNECYNGVSVVMANRMREFAFKEICMIRWMIVGLVCAGTAGLYRDSAIAAESRTSIDWEKSELGETAFVPMKSAPFPHPSRDKGFKYGKTTFPRDPHYADSTVGLFIPRGFRRTAKVNVLVYLHGWGNN